MSKILVTSALPYANGHIHLGHLVEYIQTDIWVRYQKLSGRRAIYLCADDTHGTAIMIRARKEGRGEEAVIGEMSQAHQKDFAGFDVAFDHFGSTHSDANRKLCGEIWKSLRDAGRVVEREVTQLFDPEAGVFLADRFVKGTCPRCSTPDQYGDSCEKCGSTYSAVELVNPVSTLSGARPEVRSAQHLFVTLEPLHDFLTGWTQTPGRLQPEIANYIAGHFLAEPLRDWDVSRPAPYFGFEIPDAPKQYWYVWFDAPIGYMASTQEWCDEHGEKLDDWWKDPDTKIVHFIGKDITYFHAVLAVDAACRGLQPARSRAGARLPQHARREAVEVEGHAGVRARLPGRGARPAAAPLLLREQAQRAGRRHRSESGGAVREGQLRSRG